MVIKFFLYCHYTGLVLVINCQINYQNIFLSFCLMALKYSFFPTVPPPIWSRFYYLRLRLDIPLQPPSHRSHFPNLKWLLSSSSIRLAPFRWNPPWPSTSTTSASWSWGFRNDWDCPLETNDFWWTSGTQTPAGVWNSRPEFSFLIRAVLHPMLSN